MSKAKAPQKNVIEIELTDGSKARIIEGTGRHMIEAGRIATDPDNQIEMAMCLTCVRTTIGGTKLSIEQFKDMRMTDVQKIMKAANEGNGEQAA